MSSFGVPQKGFSEKNEPGQSELTPRIHSAQVTESADDGASTLALKPIGRVNRSPKQRAPVAPQNEKKNKHENSVICHLKLSTSLGKFYSPGNQQ